MDANPEVMPAVVKSTSRHVPQAAPRDGAAEAIAKKFATAKSGDPARLSEDPMRRTDRYRLVVPWSLLP